MGQTGQSESPVYIGMIIVKVDFDRDCFKSVIEKMNGYYKDYYINELPSSANSEQKLYILTIQ